MENVTSLIYQLAEKETNYTFTQISLIISVPKPNENVFFWGWLIWAKWDGYIHWVSWYWLEGLYNWWLIKYNEMNASYKVRFMRRDKVNHNGKN